MQYITKQQNAKLHAILSANGIINAAKAALVKAYSNGRTESSALMSSAEADALISYLNKQFPNAKAETCNQMRRKIISMCHQMNWYARFDNGEVMFKDGRAMIDYNRIDRFCIERGPYKKNMQLHNYKELPTLVTVFERLLTNYIKNANSNH